MGAGQLLVRKFLMANHCWCWFYFKLTYLLVNLIKYNNFILVIFFKCLGPTIVGAGQLVMRKLLMANHCWCWSLFKITYLLVNLLKKKKKKKKNFYFFLLNWLANVGAGQSVVRKIFIGPPLLVLVLI